MPSYCYDSRYIWNIIKSWQQSIFWNQIEKEFFSMKIQFALPNFGSFNFILFYYKERNVGNKIKQV